MQGCTHDYIENDIYFSNVNKSTGIELPNDIEDFGKAVALGIKTTIYNMIEQGVDYSEIPDSINFIVIITISTSNSPTSIISRSTTQTSSCRTNSIIT